jgi:hypothetical protein
MLEVAFCLAESLGKSWKVFYGYWPESLYLSVSKFDRRNRNLLPAILLNSGSWHAKAGRFEVTGAYPRTLEGWNTASSDNTVETTHALSREVPALVKDISRRFVPHYFKLHDERVEFCRSHDKREIAWRSQAAELACALRSRVWKQICKMGEEAWIEQEQRNDRRFHASNTRKGLSVKAEMWTADKVKLILSDLSLAEALQLLSLVVPEGMVRPRRRRGRLKVNRYLKYTRQRPY